MKLEEMEARIVRYGDLVPCKTAFIDAHTPGSNQKENFTIIGGGVSESMDQHVHIRDTPGFNIGAAGQPPKCKNSLHSHTTAEVFFVLKGRWRFFWGRNGDAGEVILDEGDIINIPTGIFRGFENVGTDYGMIMAILGGDDAGGGVLWAPEVIKEASEHGLLLASNGKLYDSKKGEKIPANLDLMPPLSKTKLESFPELSALDLLPNHVARYWDLMALANGQPAKVIGEHAILVDKPGFEVELLNDKSKGDEIQAINYHQVIMVHRGHWSLTWLTGKITLAVGDTCLLPPNFHFSLKPAMAGEASLFRVIQTSDPAGSTWTQ